MFVTGDADAVVNGNLVTKNNSIAMPSPQVDSTSGLPDWPGIGIHGVSALGSPVTRSLHDLQV